MNLIDANNVKIKRCQTYRDKDEFGVERLYFKVSYSFEDSEGNKRELIIPRIELPFRTDLLPHIIEENTNNSLYPFLISTKHFIKTSEDGLECKKVEALTVIGENGEPIECKNVAVIEVIRERATKKMTLSEIEEKLGHKIELVSDKEGEK